MKKISHLDLRQWAPLLIFFLWGIYLIPLFAHVFDREPIIRDIFSANPEGISTFLKSHALAFTTSILNCGFGVLVASFLIQKSMSYRLLVLSSLLLLPTFIGDSSTCLIWRIFFMGRPQVYMTPAYTYAGYSLINLWESGTLIAYIVWLGFIDAKYKKRDFLQSVVTLHRERLQLIYLPGARVTITLLFIFSYCKSLWVDFRFYFVFRSSRGLDTETVGQWINRITKSENLLSPERGNSLMGKLSFYSYCIDILIVGLAGVLIYYIIKFFSQRLIQRSSFSLTHLQSEKGSLALNRIRTFLFFSILFLLLIGPLVYSFGSYYSCSINEIWNLSMAFSLTLLASSVIFFFVLFISTYFRIKWMTSLSGFTPVSITLIASLVSIYLIPHLGLVQSAFNWFATIGYNNKTMLVAIWIVVHIFHTGPLLLSFCLISYFSVDRSKLNYLHSMKASFFEIFRIQFLSEYKLLYFLIFLIGFISIWNDSTVNIVMSDYIPSLAVELKKATIGNSANYSAAMTYVSLSLVISIITIIFWNSFLLKTIQLQRK